MESVNGPAEVISDGSDGKFVGAMDVFSHRLNGNSIAQYNILRESFFRKHCFAVNYFDLFLFGGDQLSELGWLQKIVSLLAKLGFVDKWQEMDSAVLSIVFEKDDAIVRVTSGYKNNTVYQNINFAVDYFHTFDKFKFVNFLFENGFSYINEPKDEKTGVVFAFMGQIGLRFKETNFDSIALKSIENNYTDLVLSKTYNLIEKAKVVKHGIVLINGPVGTGKSYLIRSMLSELKGTRIGVVCLPSTLLIKNSAELQSVALEYPKSIIILEDVGDILSVDNVTHYVEETSNLLNVTDGLLSLLLDSIIVVTFNHELSKINPALLRPGRCLERIEVNELPYEKAQKLVPFEISKGNYSLAEIYEMKNTDKQIEKVRRKIGLV